MDQVKARLDELVQLIRPRRPAKERKLLVRAFEFAAEHHAGQTRKSGEPYLMHPVEVAHILAGMRLDTVSLCTGLLHDIVEDTKVTVSQLEKAFGTDIARCVAGVTKLSRLDYRSAQDRQADNFRKMLLAMVEDVRVILVKLADRLHNMRTLEFLKPEKQLRIATETMEIYAPIAHRLGMGKVRGELEDLAFRYVEPEAFGEITEQIDSREESNNEFLELIREDLARKLKKAGIPARIEGRIKRAYSIYQKLRRQKIDITQVYDLLALRVITDDEKSCYASLGVIHSQWRPVPGRIKDFIAMPRANMYQSLHTSVITDQGQTFEVQIRTEDMHKMAEEGICAHWKYKEGRFHEHDDRRIAWMRRLVEWQQEVQDAGDFLSTLKVDLYPEEVYVFTPQGKLIELPQSATPIDFAYAIHTEVGHTCVGAKVNGRIVPLKYKLNNGEIVEIVTREGSTPSRDWLKLVQTSRARNKIKSWINHHRRERAIEIGHKLLEREARRLGVSLRKISDARVLEAAHDYGCSSLDDLAAAFGYGRHSPRQFLKKLQPDDAPASDGDTTELAVPKAPKRDAGANSLKVAGVDDALVYRARCCNPIAGDPIVGYVTRGKGVAVHAGDCSNVRNLMYESERRIDVEWAGQSAEPYRIGVNVYADDRPGLLADITSVFNADGVNIVSVESDSSAKHQPAVIKIAAEIQDVAQLNQLTARIRRVPSVRDVSRTRRSA